MKKVSWVVILTCAVLIMAWQRPSAVQAASAQHVTHATASTGKDPAVTRTANRSQRQPSMDDAQFVETSFRATNATPTGYLIHNWSQVNQQFVSIRELAKFADKFQQELRIQNAKILSQTDKGEVFYELYGTWPNHSTVSVTLSSFKFPNAPSSTILVVRTESTSTDLSTFPAAYHTVSQAVRGLQLTPQISTCIQGFASARMSDGQKEHLISEAFGAVGAHRIEGLQSDLVTSISGYSPKSSNEIESNGQKMNLQVATHYDDYHHRTNILVGTPIITETY
jgi:hypothetical protein